MNKTMSTQTPYYDNLPPANVAAAPDLPPAPDSAPKPQQIPLPPISAPTNVKDAAAPSIPLAKETAFSTSMQDSSPNDKWKDFDLEKAKEKTSPVRPLPRRETTRFVIAGLLSGALVWLFRLALENWAMKPLFCRTPDTASICVSAGATSFVIALVLVGVIMAAFLSHARVFRATLITLATFVSLGALWPMLDGRDWPVAMLAMALFGAALYLFFALTASLKKYLPAVFLLAVFTAGFWLLVRM